MAATSKVKYTIKNATMGASSQIVNLVISFIVRTFFVLYLGNEYLSLNGLFTNVITILSFAELGIGASIIYSLYKPIVENDYDKTGRLLNLFGQAYKYIALFIAISGVCLIPFLKYIITDIDGIDDISLIYCLFLLNTVASYMWGYKKSYLIACQKNYVVLFIRTMAVVVQAGLQILILVYTQNFVYFLCAMIACTLADNLSTTYYVNHHYRWLREHEYKRLSKEDRKSVFSNIKSIVLYKIGSVILGGSGNIVISAFIKTTLVGICSNYLMIISAVQALINQAIAGVSASIGQYNVKATPEDNYRIFKQLNCLTQWFFGLITAGIICCINPFVKIWLGENYCLPMLPVIAITAGFYFTIVDSIPSTFRTAMGLFKQTKYFPLCAALLNIVLSIVGAKLWGLSAVFFSAAISRFIFFNLIDAYFVIRKEMDLSPVGFYISTVAHILFVTGVCVLNCYLFRFYHFSPVINLILEILSVTITYNLLYLITFFNSPTSKSAFRRLVLRS